MNVLVGSLGLCAISGLYHEVDENCTLLGYYALSSGNFLPMSRDNLSASSSGFKYERKEMGPLGCPETSVRNYQPFHNPQERSSHSGPIFRDQRWRQYVLTKTSVPTNQITQSQNRRTLILNLNILHYSCIISLPYLLQTNQMYV
jgi:hypothetical protein